MIIAIDGPAGAGKSTVARLLAKRLGFVYLDTGAIYRALTLKALNRNIAFKDETALIQMSKTTELVIRNNDDSSIKIFLDGEDVSQAIRSPRITQYVSELAKIDGVRKAILEFQRSLGRAKDSVLDGRDIGTVVFPDADRKFYLDAEFAERARRRFKESKESDNQIMLEDIVADLKNRDYIDSTRSCAPLKKAEDAVYIDTTGMSIEGVVNTLLKKIQGKS